MDLGLKGACAFIAGSSRGLGYATAHRLGLEGCRVAINGRNPEKLEAAAAELFKNTGSQVIAIPGDLSDPETPQRIIDQAAQALGGLDILVTNAGGPPAGAFESFDDAAWQNAIELSLSSHVRLIRAALPHLRKSKKAAVLTITSYAVKQPISNLVLSNSLRAATAGLTKSLALELGKDGIRFNSILPGWTETERVIELMTFRAQQNGTRVEDEIARQSLESPLGRLGQPDEFANAAAFLVSPAASYITGAMLNVDGGMYKGTF